MKGRVQVYTGDGKGKTTASLGLALRAIGQGFKVIMIQFMKGGAYTGEYIAAKNYLPNFEIYQYGRGCIKQQKQLKMKGFYNLPDHEKKHKFFDYVREDIECGPCRYCFLNDSIQGQYVQDAFTKTKDVILNSEHNVIILDEINVAMQLGYLDPKNVIEILEQKPEHKEIILTGRGAPEELKKCADLVTEMTLKKHYFDDGQMARRGIEY